LKAPYDDTFTPRFDYVFHHDWFCCIIFLAGDKISAKKQIDKFLLVQ